MQFLVKLPVAQLGEGGTKRSCFAAQLFQPRPSWAEIVAFQPAAAKLGEGVQELASRGACPLKHLGIFVDREGCWLLAVPKQEM